MALFYMVFGNSNGEGYQENIQFLFTGPKSHVTNSLANIKEKFSAPVSHEFIRKPNCQNGKCTYSTSTLSQTNNFRSFIEKAHILKIQRRELPLFFNVLHPLFSHALLSSFYVSLYKGGGMYLWDIRANFMILFLHLVGIIFLLLLFLWTNCYLNIFMLLFPSKRNCVNKPIYVTICLTVF